MKINIFHLFAITSLGWAAAAIIVGNAYSATVNREGALLFAVFSIFLAVLWYGSGKYVERHRAKAAEKE